MTTPVLITMGDPTGICPEIILKAFLEGSLLDLQRPVVVVGDAGVLQQRSALFGQAAELIAGSAQPLASHELRIARRSLPVRAHSRLSPGRLVPGEPDATCGKAMADYITWAADRCLDGSAGGMVTAPISKHALELADVPFPGHTELLADRCRVDDVVMMLAGDTLRVCMVTTHTALRSVPDMLSRQRILKTLRTVHRELRRWFSLEKPRLAVLALNPHAGEHGLFGDEEERLIHPAIETARAEGIDASGPHSADTLFWFASRGAYDAVVCMYHDQGLIPLKLLHFEDGVNVTLGLPIIRTSVDHGTAYDLVGTGRANPASLVAAVRMAATMADAGAAP